MELKETVGMESVQDILSCILSRFARLPIVRIENCMDGLSPPTGVHPAALHGGLLM